jgi:adenine/guanine phosphoribosyltransferase-like PRPP-binding protein
VITRLDVSVNGETAAALTELAQQYGTTVTEVIRRAVGVYAFLDDELRKDGAVLEVLPAR